MTVTQYEVRGEAGWITLDSPENRNALSAPLVEELGTHLRTAMGDSAVRAIVLTGNGPAFCAGADLKNRGDAIAPGSDKANPFVEILRLMWDGPKPVIVAVNGHTFGGGIGLVAAADIAVSIDSAKFSFSEVRLGLIPAMISVVVLPKIGSSQAMRLFLTGERFTAAAARDYGLLHRVVTADTLIEAVQEEVDAIAAGGPLAIAEAKKLIRTVTHLPMDEAFAYAEEKINMMFRSEEAAEGMAAFVGKRKPEW
ncbi:MAG: enoyl-CoA hydratase/isomerase family protein [Proteobacteria bacterium]|nr:enoyl-CoA hydratase/isomerase family protein [Pseudomonadota bacterium]